MYKPQYKYHLAGSRQEAIKKGYARFLGKPCLRGHTGVRYTSDSACVICRRERKAKAIKLLEPPLNHSKIDSIDKQFLIDTAEIWDKPI